MVFLHISEVFVSEYKNGSGSTYKGISRPSGLWYGHDLSWVNYMAKEKSWSPQIKPSDAPALPVYLHFLRKETLLPPQPDDTMKTLNATPHYVYFLPIPKDAFQSPLYTGDDKSTKVMQLTPESLDEWLNSDELKNRRKTWYENDLVRTAAALESYGAKNPIKSFLKSIKSKETQQAIVKKILEGTIPIDTPGVQEIEDLFWKPFLIDIMSTWGGIDFADVFFEPGHERYMQRFPTLKYINAGSGVLFNPVDVLGHRDATKDVKAVLSWDKPVPSGSIPNYVFGLTTTGVVRILSGSTGGRRTRRRRKIGGKRKKLTTTRRKSRNGYN